MSEINKVLIVSGGSEFGHSKGQLNDALCKKALKVLQELGKECVFTNASEPYDVKEEVLKFLWADAVIWQFPGWWMGEPWYVKKYVDLVFSAGGAQFLESDGRHRRDPKHNYGTGGKLTSKYYLISTTWNAPLEAFTEKGEFFEEQGPDGVLLHFHKLNQFVGMKPLPSFICNDVMKDPHFEEYMQSWEEHLKKVFA